MLPDFDAVIFDLDGLLLDTESTYVQAWRQAAQAMGLDETLLQTEELSGLHHQALLTLLKSKFGSDFQEALFNQLSSHYWYAQLQQTGIAKKTGVDALLSLLIQRHIPFCLATNSPTKNAQECLTFAGLDKTFSLIIGRERVALGKPAPDIFLLAAQRLQQPITRCLVLEDSAVGIAAAQAAGAIAVLIPSTAAVAKMQFESAIWLFADLAEVARQIVLK